MTETRNADARDQTQHTLVVPNSINMVSLLGPADEHLAVMEKAFDADVHVRGNQITLRGQPAEVALAERMLDELVTIIRTGQGVTTETVDRVVSMLRAETTESPADVLSLNILSNRGRTIRPKTLNQKRYVDAIDKHTVVFGIGPAGTGKTYLAMAKAVQSLQAKKVNRIILTRPAVEAGERLGFLPGTLSEKIDPYLRPLYDALHDMLDPDTIPKLLAAGTIEVAPLAYMRGQDAERRVHHPRRGAEHLARADEDVPDPPGLRLQDRGHRRRHPGRPAERDQERPARRRGDPGRCRGPQLQPAHVARRRPPPAGGQDRRGVRGLRRPPRGLSRPWAPSMTIEVLNESGVDIDELRTQRLARFVMDRMRVHPLAELCVTAVDEDTIAELNAKWMEKEGPTDVLAFPMDELRPGLVNDEPEEGVLGDLVLCPTMAAGQAKTAGHSLSCRARPAHRARHPAPPRLRPCRARGAHGDVRPAVAAARRVGRPRGRPIPRRTGVTPK